MKVIQVLPALNSGGVEKGTLEIARALTTAGHDSLVVSAGGRLVSQLEAEGSRHLVWDLGKKSLLTCRHIPAVRKWLQQQQADILHLRSRMPAWIMWLAWQGLPPPQRPHLVTTVHGLYSVSRYSQIMCRGERIIAVSATVRDYILQHYPQTDPDAVQLIYRGIDPHYFSYGYQPASTWQRQWLQQYPQLAGKTVLTLPGRLTRLKGHHLFIDLVTQLHQCDNRIHGLIVGAEDPKRKAYARELYHRVDQEGLADHITFTGHRSDIRDIFASSSLVCSFSTRAESFGRTVLEALSLGVPVMAYDHGGVGEIMQQLYPAGQVAVDQPFADLIAQAQRLLTSTPPVVRNHNFTLSAMCDNTLALYQSLIEASQASNCVRSTDSENQF